MFNISEKYSGEDKKEAIKKFKLKDQSYRKRIHPITRELYRYFNQKFHLTNWNPNGLYQKNKYYYYIGPSLGFIDKEGNKKYDKVDSNLDKLNKNKQKIKIFPEFNFMEDNQYKIIIEYCSNCEEHQAYTFHKSEIYQNYANYLQKCILLRFPFIKVILKPIDIGNIKSRFPKVNFSGDSINKFDIRIGAFEVILSYKKKDEEIKNELLYSKLIKKQFPLIEKILDKIVKYVPTFNGEIIVYEKEKIKNNEIPEKEKNFMRKELIEGLEINIYLMNNQQIINLSTKAWEEVQNQNNPKKRLKVIKEQKLIHKINIVGKYTSQTNNYNSNKKLLRSSSMKNINNNYLENNFSKTQSSFNLRRQNTNKTNNFKIYNKYNLEELYNNKNNSKNNSNSKFIFDKNISNNLKGKLIIRKYTNKDGVISIGPLPYDSYYIEVTESTQFRNIGICLNFTDINSYKNNFIKKYIGLLTQENAFIQIHVFEIKENNQDEIPDVSLLSNAKVTLKKIKEKNNDPEINIEIKETNKPGIFEHKVPPGKYILETKKPNYEMSKKYLELKQGENLINVEMHIERYYNLLIKVLNYEKINDPIQNADITIYKNSDEIIEESITNKKGEYNYIVDKGQDFLTIVIEKIDFFPTQRLFIRKSKAKINSKGEYEETITFFLVKKKFIVDNNIILVMTYSNLFRYNFDVKNIQINNKIKNLIDISHNDKQKDNGIICTLIKYKYNTNLMNSKSTNENNNIEESRDMENYDNIISISYKIISEQLKIHNYEDKPLSMNGLERYGCQTIIYTPKNIFYIPSPKYTTKNYSIWFIGWIDLKNELFYEINKLIHTQNERTLFFGEWLEFLQVLINEQIYTNLFEYFGFEKGDLEIGDRILDLNLFEEKIKNMKYFNQKKMYIINFICSIFKNRNNLISFSLFKHIVFSNLKNFMGNA